MGWWVARITRGRRGVTQPVPILSRTSQGIRPSTSSGAVARPWWREVTRISMGAAGPPARRWSFRGRERGLSLQWWGSTRRSWYRRLSGAVAGSVALANLTGCLYGFAGGGLPNIKTVAIQPFDNQTPVPQLTTEVNDAIRQAFESRLGLRQAGEQTADALVRGRKVAYQADVPLAFRS